VGLDHHADNDSVIVCDMAHAPLDDNSLDAAVFSLSLIGLNWVEYLQEARRVLKSYGLLFVAEPAGQWDDLTQTLSSNGFDVVRSEVRGKFIYVRAEKADY